MRAKLILFSLFVSVLVRTSCGTRKCICYVDIERSSADCSNRRIRNVKQLEDCVPFNITTLHLDHNNISRLEPGSFKRFSQLSALYLAYNQLEFITEGTFAGLQNLQLLTLEYNKLRHNNSYEDGTFARLMNLQTLSIQGNCNVKVDNGCQYPDRALSKAVMLEDLFIDGIPNVALGNGFSKLLRLQTLRFSDNFGYCYIPSLTEDTFKELAHTNLSFLLLDVCHINYIAPYTFRSLRKLKNLVSYQNKNLCADGVDNATLGLDNTDIEQLTFNWCCNIYGNRNAFTKGMLKGLKHTHLKTLNLENNAFQYIHYTCTMNLPGTIEYISLKENSLNDASFLLPSVKLQNLKVADGSFQNHYKIYKSDVSLKWFPDGVPLPKHLETLYINNIKLGYDLNINFTRNNSLVFIDASSCLFKSIPVPILGLENLKILNLSNNRLSFIHPDAFKDMPKLKVLKLSGSYIGQRPLDKDTFAHLHELEYLELNRNGLKTLPHNIFASQTKLKSLYLAGNALKDFSFSLQFLRQLTLIDVSNNLIDCILENNTIVLDKLSANHRIKIDLSNNTLKCDCKRKYFVDWLSSTDVNLLHKDKLWCTYENNSLVPVAYIHEIQRHLEFDCSALAVLLSCLFGFFGLCLSLSMVALIYHKRWELRYLLYIGRNHINPYYLLGEDERCFEIDVYLSYDYDFKVSGWGRTLHQIMTDVVYPHLQGQGYSVTLRDKLTSGRMLHDVISDSLRKSRKVIAFITEEYCRDYWNIFEFNMMAYEGIYQKRDTVLPVVVGDVKKEHLTPEIWSFIYSKAKSNGVLHWPKGEDRLQDVIREIESQISLEV